MKPEISRKADNIVKVRQEQAFKWLYSHLVSDSEAGLSYEAIRWDNLSTAILECIMPLIVKLLDDQKLVIKRDEFLEKLAGPDIVAVFNKVPLLKHIETLKDQEKKDEETVRQQKLPWANRNQPPTKNKYRRNFEDFKVEMSLVPTSDKTPVNTATSHMQTKTRAKLLNTLKQRPNTMILPGRNSRTTQSVYN